VAGPPVKQGSCSSTMPAGEGKPGASATREKRCPQGSLTSMLLRLPLPLPLPLLPLGPAPALPPLLLCSSLGCCPCCCPSCCSTKLKAVPVSTACSAASRSAAFCRLGSFSRMTPPVFCAAAPLQMCSCCRPMLYLQAGGQAGRQAAEFK
jgi:hypothetical protein